MIVSGIHLPDGDTHFAEQISQNPPYRGKGTYQWAKLERALETCGTRRGHAVDVGAHVGLWSRVLSYEFKKVTAFEPMREYIDCFRRNLMFRGVKLYKFALDEITGTTRFSMSPNGGGTATVSPDGDREIERYTLDVVIARAEAADDKALPIDFLKVDCEGMEAKVIRGGEHTIRRDKPVILIEQKRKRLARHGLKPEAGVNLLKSWGAEVAWEDHGDYCVVFR